MSLACVLEALGDRVTRRTARGAVAHCPAHDDRTPSLGIDLGDDGRVLLRCRAGCATEAVLAAAGLAMADLFDDARTSGHARRETGRWVLRDANGAYVAEHVRIEPGKDGTSKDVIWERRGARGLAGLKLRDLPLYGVELLAAAPAAAIVLAEGEKAAEALRPHLPDGWLALATVTGASTTPSAATLAAVRGREVVLWPDADAPGAAHMQRISRPLVGIAASVRVVSTEGRADKWDAADLVHEYAGAPEDLAAQIAELLGTAKDHAAAPDGGAETVTLAQKPPRLDLDAALPPWLADVCRAIAAWIQLAPEAVVTCVLAYVCAAIGNSVWVRARGMELPLSLHFITSLASGSGKSEVRKFLRKCVAQIEREIDRRREEARAAAEEYADTLAAWRSDRRGSAKRRAEAGERPEPPSPDPRGGPRTTYVLSEGTLDGVIATIGDTPRGVLWATDEAPEIVGMLGAYGDSEGRRALDAARLRKLTEGQPVEAHRAKSNVDPIRRVHRPFLAMDCDVQPGVLANLFAEEDHPSGTIARLLIHEPPSLLGTRQYISPPPVPGPHVRKQLEDLLLGLWRLPLSLDEDGFGVPQPRYLELSPEAERLWAEELEVLERQYGGASTTMVGILGHLRGRLLRLAGNLALIRDAKAERVEERDMARAIVLGRYFHAHAERLWSTDRPVDETAEQRAARELVDWVAAHPGAAARDAVGGLQRFRGPGGAERAAETLDALSGVGGRLRREPGPRTVRYFAAETPTAASASGSDPGDPGNVETAGAGTPGASAVHDADGPPGEPGESRQDPYADPEREAIQAEARTAEDAELERMLGQAEAAKERGALDGQEEVSW